MKRSIPVVLAILILIPLLAGCAIKKASEKIFCLTHEREAVWLVSTEGSEKVFDLPDTMLTAGIIGDKLWYSDGMKLVRVTLKDGSSKEYTLPENKGIGFFMVPRENDAYVMLATGKTENFDTGGIYRVGENGTECITRGNVLIGTYKFIVENGSVYYLTDNNKLVRENADGNRTEFEWPGFPMLNLSIDSGRVYACWAAECRSYDAVTGSDERIEFGDGSEPIQIAEADGGWLYYLVTNGETSGADDTFILKARSNSSGRIIDYAKTADIGVYAFGDVVTFGEQGFVLDDGYQQDEFKYILYTQEK